MFSYRFMASSKILGEETAAGAGVGAKSGADADARMGSGAQVDRAGEGAGDVEAARVEDGED